MYKEGLVSIIMPSYNTASFIGESIESVLNQTYKNWELIIVDDCSNDNTEEIVQSFNNSKIRFYKNVENLGAAYSRNFALKQADGEWIAFLDSDDLWKPEKLEKQISFMKDNNYFFSCVGRDEIDEQSHSCGRITISPKHITRLGMYLYCWIGCLGVMYHAPTVGLIQIENLKKNNDYAMWLKVIKVVDCYCMDEVLAHYRVRKNSISHDSLLKLIKSHYLLFRISENLCVVSSIICTTINMVFGIVKKILFIRNVG